MSQLLVYRGPKTERIALKLAALTPGINIRKDGSLLLAWDGPQVTVRQEWESGSVWVGVVPELGGSALPEPPSDGHFAVVRWDDTVTEGWTDEYGLRSLYARVLSHGILIGTDLVTVARLADLSELDPEAFGSHWLLQNQLTRTSLISGLTRVCGGSLRFLDGKLSTRHPDRDKAEPGGLDRVVSALRSQFKESSSLGLSGGLDSRLLLAVAPPEQKMHTFGAGADARMALRLASALGRDIRQVRSTLGEASALVRQLRHHARVTNAVAPASFSARGEEFDAVMQPGTEMIDGGFGEYGRRMFMGRLVGIAGLKKQVPGSAHGLLEFNRGGYLRPGLAQELHKGALRSIEQNWPDKITGDWADSMGLRYRLPNFFGYEQSRLDEIGRATMPFAQPSVVEALRGTSYKLRKSGRLYRQIIKMSMPKLAAHALVKGSAHYPFGLSGAPAMAWVKASQAIGRLSRPTANEETAGNANPRDVYLHRLRPYVLDRIHDADIADAFDKTKLRDQAREYYSGRLELGSGLDWWLALDAWLAAVNGKLVTS